MRQTLSVLGMDKMLKELSLTPRAIVLVANNKASAQELYLQKENIEERLKSHADYASHELIIK